MAEHRRARAEGEQVILDLTADDADRIVWALRQHARHGGYYAAEYRALADDVEKAVEATDVVLGPGLTLKVVLDAR